MKSPLIYLIILNYNGTEDTKACVDSLLQLDYSNFKVLLIDNYSTSEQYGQLKKWMISEDIVSNKGIVEYAKDGNYNGNTSIEDKFTLIRNYENLGFAKGNNVGIKYAEKKNADYVYLLNNDTEVEPDSLCKLVEFIEKNNFYAITPQIRFYEPSNKIWNCGGTYKWPGSISYNYGNQDISKVPQTGYEEINFITGCALLYDYKKIGLLSENFFFGEEDNELSFRIRRMHLKMACVFESVIYHKVSSSISKSTNTIANRAEVLYLNRFINLKSQYSFPNFLLCAVINIAYGIPMLILKHKISLQRSVKIFYNCFTSSLKLEEVSKEKFESILNQA